MLQAADEDESLQEEHKVRVLAPLLQEDLVDVSGVPDVDSEGVEEVREVLVVGGDVVLLDVVEHLVDQLGDHRVLEEICEELQFAALELEDFFGFVHQSLRLDIRVEFEVENFPLLFEQLLVLLELALGLLELLLRRLRLRLGQVIDFEDPLHFLHALRVDVVIYEFCAQHAGTVLGPRVVEVARGEPQQVDYIFSSVRALKALDFARASERY